MACAISEIAGKYYWATRQNTQMIRHESGAFITFVAVDGSGYVRVIAPGRKAEVSLGSPAGRQFDYVEHLVKDWGAQEGELLPRCYHKARSEATSGEVGSVLGLVVTTS